MSTIPGLFVLGEANFSDHGANRLGASGADAGPGRRLLRHSRTRIGDYLADADARARSTTDHAGVRGRSRARSASASSSCSAINGKRTRRLASTASSARSCGTSAAWRATRAGLEEALERDPRAPRGVLAATSRVPGGGDELQPGAREGRPRRRLPRVRRADVPRRARARGVAAAATSARSTRRRTARRMRDDDELLPRRRLGVHRATGSSRRCTRSRSSSRTSSSPRGATSEHDNVDEPDAPRLAPDRAARRQGPDRRPTQVDGIASTCLVPRDARRRQRAADRQGRGADRLRPRLPRGHLRHVLAGDQRRAARPASAAPRPASSTCASFKDGDDDLDRAVARAAPSRCSGPGRRPQAFDRIIAGRRLHLASTPARRPTPTRSRSRRTTPSARSTPRPASAAAPASPPARTPRRCSSSRPRSRTSATCRRASRSATRACWRMVAADGREGFGNCTNHYECEAVCPKEITARLHRRA